MRDTLQLFDGIRAKEGLTLIWCMMCTERIHPTEAGSPLSSDGAYKLFFCGGRCASEQVEWLDKITDQRDPAEPGRAVQQPCRVQ